MVVDAREKQDVDGRLRGHDAKKSSWSAG